MQTKIPEAPEPKPGESFLHYRTRISDWIRKHLAHATFQYNRKSKATGQITKKKKKLLDGLRTHLVYHLLEHSWPTHRGVYQSLGSLASDHGVHRSSIKRGLEKLRQDGLVEDLSGKCTQFSTIVAVKPLLQWHALNSVESILNPDDYESPKTKAIKKKQKAGAREEQQAGAQNGSGNPNDIAGEILATWKREGQAAAERLGEHYGWTNQEVWRCDPALEVEEANDVADTEDYEDSIPF